MRYRSILVFCLGGWSPQLPTRFLVSRGTLDTVPQVQVFTYRAFTFFGRAFQHCSVNPFLLVDGPQPRRSFLYRFGLRPRSLAATWGISFDFSSSGYLDVSVLRVPSSCSLAWVTVLLLPGFPIRIPAGQRLLAALRSFSQLIASFVG